MDEEQFRRLEAVFHGALDQPDGPRRDEYLTRECTNDPELRFQVLALIEADSHSGSSCDFSAVEEPAGPLPLFGVFQAEKILGRGGSGVVYLARRTDGEFEQNVAVKALLPEVASGVLREGFLRERRILAALHHPRIAQVIDGGIRSDSTPYLVMEYVEGRRIDVYCSEQRLSLARRISLFLAVCDAVAFAHRHLVVHLDLKPSNILVTADGHVKLLDFGTAKILDAADASVTQALATPRYASPEQLRGERASPASDIYSLGIVLAELATGHWPFGDPDSQIQALRRAVEDVVPRPFDSLADSAHAESCRMTLAQLHRELSGDLAAILWRALDPDAERRYRTVDEFAQDLRNLGEGLPVLARPQTRGYRAARFLRRNRIVVALAAVVTLIVAALGGYALYEQQRSIEQGRRAQQLNAYLARLIQSSNPMYGGRWDETVAELMDLAVGQAGGMLAQQPAAKAEMLMLAAAHQIAGHDPEKLAATFAAAVDAARRSGDAGTLAATLSLKSLYEHDGRCSPAAIADMREADAIAGKEGRRFKREWRVTHALNRVLLAEDCSAPRQETIALARKALDLARSIPENSLEESTPPAVLQGYALEMMARAEGCIEGEARRREALAFVKSHPGLDYVESNLHYQESVCWLRAAQFEKTVQEVGRAVDLDSHSIGPASPETVWMRGQYAYVLALAGRLEAIEQARETLRTAECDNQPYFCDFAKSFAAQALVAMHQDMEGQQVLDRLRAKPVFIPIADTCRLVSYVDQGRIRDAEPYRDTATKFKDRVPAGSMWRTRIDAALARQTASPHR